MATVQAAAGVPPARIAVQGLCRAGKPGARTPLRPGQLSLRPPLRQRGHPPAASRVSPGYTRTHRHTSLYTRYIQGLPERPSLGAAAKEKPQEAAAPWTAGKGRTPTGSSEGRRDREAERFPSRRPSLREAAAGGAGDGRGWEGAAATPARPSARGPGAIAPCPPRDEPWASPAAPGEVEGWAPTDRSAGCEGAGGAGSPRRSPSIPAPETAGERAARLHGLLTPTWCSPSTAATSTVTCGPWSWRSRGRWAAAG